MLDWTTAARDLGNAAAQANRAFGPKFKSQLGRAPAFFDPSETHPERGDAYLLSQGCGLGVKLAIVAQRLELALKQREALLVHGGVRRNALRSLDRKCLASSERNGWTTRTSEGLSDKPARLRSCPRGALRAVLTVDARACVRCLCGALATLADKAEVSSLASGESLHSRFSPNLKRLRRERAFFWPSSKLNLVASVGHTPARVSGFRLRGAMRARGSSGAALDASDVASSSARVEKADGSDSLGFWCLLSGKEVVPSHPAKGGVRARVVLLHGWLMHHACWLRTATTLRDRYGHDVLLLDFPGHGRSPLLSRFEDHTPENFVKRLRAVLRRVGWAGNETGNETGNEKESKSHETKCTSKAPPLVLCGLSLGGVVSCLYADQFRGEVQRLVLVSTPGLDERWWTPPMVSRPLRLGVLRLAAVAAAGSATTLGPIGRWLVRDFTPVKTLVSHVSLVRDTPTFGVPPDMPQRLRAQKIPTTLVWGALDQFHSAQIKRWKAGRPHAADAEVGAWVDESRADDESLARATSAGARDTGTAKTNQDDRWANKTDPGIHILVHPYFDHFAVCLCLDNLRLGERPHFWHDTELNVPRRNELTETRTGPGTRAKL